MVTNNSSDYSPTQYNVQTGGANGTLNNVTPSTSGYVLTSNGASSQPTFQAVSASNITFDGDSGTATSSGGIITFNANTNSGSSVQFTGSSATVSLNVTDSSDNTIVGNRGGNGSLSGTSNTGIGFANLYALTSGASNSAVGYSASSSLTSGSYNVSMGQFSLSSLTNGSFNICLGYAGGNNYTTSSESSNICLNALGTQGESNVLRIGSGTGAGNQQLSKAFIYGITGVTPSNIQPVAINSSTGQLGVAPTVATVFGTSAAPTGTTSTAAYVMMGLGSTWKITPTTFTSVRATINGQMANNTTGDGINIIIAYGTGVAPTNGASVTGTTVGINTIFTDLTGLLTNGVPFCKNVIITGLTPGTAYWIDIQCKAVTGGTASILNLEFSARELTS